MASTPLVVVVQDRETQFDAPFYAFITATGDARIQVFYTQEGDEGAAIRDDPELGRPPAWDHLVGCSYPHSRRPLSSLGAGRALARELVASRPALVILCGYYPRAHLWLALLLKRRGVRIGLRSDGTLAHSSPSGFKGTLKRAILPRLLRLYDTWHPVGGLAEAYLTRMAGAARPCYRFPYAVDHRWLAAEAARWEKDRDTERARLGWARGDVVVLGVLKWNAREDPLTLVRGFVRLAAEVSPARLLLVGDGPQRGEVEALVRPLGDRAHLPGYLPYSELPRCYALCDLFVHPAPVEPWGVSVNEAMASGKPVIASSGVGAGHDLIREGVTGRVFPAGDANALAAVLAELARAPEQRTAMGAAARQQVEAWGYEAVWRDLRKALGS